jgi:MFS family permease
VARVPGFALITGADFIVRSAYQMGKTPLLPIFAAALGASDILLGFIVSVSTLTGMVLKPLVGMLSDRWGRRVWLLLGTAFFAGMPFVYRFVHTPEQLFALRLVHGMATAIYGPVTLAYVSELSGKRRAERLGWFSMARNGGYVVGPAAAGLMLLTLDPVSVFTVVGILSTAAFIPVLLLKEKVRGAGKKPPILSHAVSALSAGARTPAVWLAGGLESTRTIGLYAAKAFLPVHAYAMGISPGLVGAFFAVQESVHMLLNPLGGRIGDRLGHVRTIGLGMVVLGLAMAALTVARTGPALMVPAVLVGVAQALVSPSSLALVSIRVAEGHVGLGMGLVGAMRNAGKVAGPVLAGLLIHWVDFESTFRLIGLALLSGGLLMLLRLHRWRSPMAHDRVASTAPADRA